MEIYEYRLDVYAPASGGDTRASQLPDVTGYDVEATDGHLGKVDEATNEPQSSCLVVDTGFWIFGKKRMIPAGVIRAVDVDEKKVFVSMTKDEIKGAPDYDEEHHRRDEPGYHDEVGKYYDPWGGTPPMEGA